MEKQTMKEKEIPKAGWQMGPWLIFAMILWGLQAIAIFMALVLAVRVRSFLPDMVLPIIIGVLLFDAALTFLLLIWLERRKPGEEPKKVIRRRTFGTVLATIVLILCMIAVAMMDPILNMINTIAGEYTEFGIVNVYVLNENPAQSLQEAADYNFGYSTQFDEEGVLEMIDEVNETLAVTIQTTLYDTELELVDALYDGSIDAIIMDEEYTGVLELLDDYSDYGDRTRILKSIRVYTKPQVITPDQGTAESAEDTRYLDITKDPFVVYLSGSDTRQERLSRSRSDVNILAVVNPTTHQVLLVNTPRDYYVKISIAEEYRDKLTHCGIYGTQCSMDTLSLLYDVPVDYSVQINFTGFEKLVDAMGGVTVYSDATFHSGGYSFKEGENKLSGKQALQFARDRYSFEDGDRARGRHQMALVKGILNKAISSPELITNFTEILDSIEGMVACRFSTEEIGSLVKMQLEYGGSWEILTYSVSGTDSKDVTYSAPGTPLYVMVPDDTMVDKASYLMNRILDGDVITEEDCTD